MLILRGVTRRHLYYIKSITSHVRPLATESKAKKSKDLIDFKLSLPAAEPKKPKREPFAKNIFLGIFDYEFLAYPQPQKPDRYNEFQEWIQPIREYMTTVNPQEFENTNKIPPHVLQNFRELGLFGLRIHEDYNGMNLLNSEFMQVLETVGTVPALGLFFLKQAVPAIDIFNNYASVEQKLKYLPKIAAGQSLATVAITEVDSGPGANKLSTTAVLTDCENYWILNGEKVFVSNIEESDLFLVVGHAFQGGEMEKRPETMSTLIVDKHTEGVTISSEFTKTIGLKGFNSGKLILKDVRIPKENLIGTIGDGATHSVDLFSKSRHFIAALTVPILKNFLNLLAKDVMQRKHFNKLLLQTESAQQIISKISYSIYSIESVLYMTTGIMDIYDGQDLLLETALVEQFCVQECLRRIQDSMWLIGPRACLSSHPFEQIFRDAFTITNYETSLLDTKIYSALLGMQHYGVYMSEEVKQTRNPLMYPKFAFKSLFAKETLNLHLEEYLHPSLRQCAYFCDKSLKKLRDSTRTLLVRNGTDMGDYHADLQRISDMASMIYAYIAVLARTSRSYCIGNKNSDSDVQVCMILTYRLQQKVDELAKDVEVSEYTNGDFLGKQLSKLHFETKDYIFAHPLQRNY